MDAACLLSLLCKQLRDDTEDEDDHEYDVEAGDEQDDMSDEDFQAWDVNLPNNRDNQGLQLAYSTLKNRFLNRLAEVLARIKGAADEVAGVYMVEIEDDKGNHQVEVRVAKNGGLSKDDRDYLSKLKSDLQRLHEVVSWLPANPRLRSSSNKSLH